MEKIDEISIEEIALGWNIRQNLVYDKKNPKSKKFLLTNSAFLPICKSGKLCGLGYGTVMYLPHKYNLDRNVLEIFKGDFLLGGLDPLIQPPKSILEELALLNSTVAL